MEQARAMLVAWQGAVHETVRRPSGVLPGGLSTASAVAARGVRAGGPPDIDWGAFGEFGSWVGEILGRWGDFARGYTQPSRSPDPNARPSGHPTKIPSNQREDIKRALELENVTAEVLAKGGYDIEHNPPPKPNGKEPDYLIEGEYFDNIAPSSDNPRGIASKIEAKIVAEQADRFTINITDSNVDLAALQNQLRDYPVDGLKEVLLINKNGAIGRFYP